MEITDLFVGLNNNNNLTILNIERLYDEVHVYDRTHEANHWHFTVGNIYNIQQ